MLLLPAGNDREEVGRSMPLFPDPALPRRVVNFVFEVEDGDCWFGDVFMSPQLPFGRAGNSFAIFSSYKVGFKVMDGV